MTRIDAERVELLAEHIKPFLKGQPPDIQGAVLADLLATYLLGYHSTDAEKTAQVREDILEMHIAVIRKLMELGVEK